MKRPVFIVFIVLFVIFIVFAAFKISNHEKYENVFEEIYSISKTKYASSSTIFDKEDEIETKYKDVENIEKMSVEYHFEDVGGGFIVEITDNDSTYKVKYKADDKKLYESFSGDSTKEADLKEVFNKEFLEDWFETRSSRFSMDNLGDVEIVKE